MYEVLSINNLKFSYDKKVIFDNFCLKIKQGDFISLIGPNGSGKSTLIKIISGLLNFDGEIKINDNVLNSSNIKNIRKDIGVLLNNSETQIICEKVIDNIAFPLENLAYPRNIIIEKVNSIAKLLGITKILNESVYKLTNLEKDLVNLATVLVYEPKILILDEAFKNLDKNERENILLFLKNLNSSKQLTIINITQNMEDLLFGKSIVILDEGKIVFSGANDEAFSNERIFSKLGLDLPFMADLSIKLKYYNLLDKIVYNMEEMVDVLWT